MYSILRRVLKLFDFFQRPPNSNEAHLGFPTGPSRFTYSTKENINLGEHSFKLLLNF